MITRCIFMAIFLCTVRGAADPLAEPTTTTGMCLEPEDKMNFTALNKKLFGAISRCDDKQVEQLLAAGADANAEMPYCDIGHSGQKGTTTPLRNAISITEDPVKSPEADDRRKRKIKIVQLLLDNNADPDRAFCHSRQFLNLVRLTCAARGDLELLERLISSGASDFQDASYPGFPWDNQSMIDIVKRVKTTHCEAKKQVLAILTDGRFNHANAEEMLREALCKMGLPKNEVNGWLSSQVPAKTTKPADKTPAKGVLSKCIDALLAQLQ